MKDFIFAIKNPSSNLGVIFFELRLDRIIAAALVGSMLAISGVFLQGIFLNPLVDPYIFGVSSSAGFFYLLSLIELINRLLILKINFGKLSQQKVSTTLYLKKFKIQSHKYLKPQ